MKNVLMPRLPSCCCPLAANWVVFETQVHTPVKPSQARLISQEHTDTLMDACKLKKKLVLNYYKKINTVIEICIATLCTYTYYIYI
jgi:hypothetical protein